MCIAHRVKSMIVSFENMNFLLHFKMLKENRVKCGNPHRYKHMYVWWQRVRGLIDWFCVQHIQKSTFFCCFPDLLTLLMVLKLTDAPWSGMDYPSTVRPRRHMIVDVNLGDSFDITLLFTTGGWIIWRSKGNTNCSFQRSGCRINDKFAIPSIWG